MPRLLIIDDDESVRKLLRFRLGSSYEIIDTGSPEDAVALAMQKKPDAILLDLMMPGYSGFEVCQTLGSMSFTQLIPVFIVSGESASRYKDFCATLGAKGYFQKPIDFEALENRLTTVIEGRQCERRSEARIKLRLVLKLKGTDDKGQDLNLFTSTDNVGAHSFIAGCTGCVKVGSVVEVAVMNAGEQLVGKAHVVRIEWPNTPGQRCAFRFLTKPVDWVLR